MKQTKTESAERTETYVNRDENNKIISYGFKIYKRDSLPFEGIISLDEMSAIKQFYTKQGDNLTQWQVYNQLAESFNKYTFSQFQDIIRAFKITKADSPFADHEIEEYTNDELQDRLFRIKKTASIRKADAMRQRDTEKLLSQVQLENLKLKNRLDTLYDLSSSITFDDFKWEPIQIDSKQNLIIWLSDMHIGCRVDENSLYYNDYNESEVLNRLETIFHRVCELNNQYNGFKRLIVCNLGDSLDGQDMQTVRRDHYLPQNLNNQEQITIFVNSLFNFMKNIANNCKCESLEYFSVGASNHGGDFEWSAQKILEAQLNAINIRATVFDKFMDGFDIEDMSMIICHGKDGTDMKKPLPLTINDRTEILINQYIHEYGIMGRKIMFVKGDSHISATTNAKNFIYKSVGAFVGTTKWSAINFGYTPAVCEYTLLDESSNMMNGIIEL